MGDAVGNLLEEGEGHILHGGGHSIHRVDRTEDDRPGVGTLAVPDANGFQVGDDGEILPDLTGQTRLLELLPQDSIGFPNGFQPISGDSAQATDAQARAGEWLAVDHAIRQTQSLAAGADFVFKEHLEGFHQLKAQVFRQAAHVVVGFDDLPFCEIANPPLTTLRVPKQEMGRVAVRRILEVINGTDKIKTKTQVCTIFVERDSVKDLKGRNGGDGNEG